MMSLQQTRTCGYWRTLCVAFYAPWCYVDVAGRWRGLGLVYLLFLTCILVTPFSVRTVSGIMNYMDSELLYPFKQIPLMQIVDGHWSIDAPLPYLIKNPDGAVVGILDTKSEFNNMQRQYPDLQLLITQDHFTLAAPAIHLFFMKTPWRGISRPQSSNFDVLSGKVFSAQDFIESSKMTRFKWTICGAVYFFLIGGVFIFAGSFALAMGMLGQAVARIFFHIRLPFCTGCRLLIVAGTTPMIILSVLMTINVYLRPEIYWILLAIYFNFAVIVVRRSISVLLGRASNGLNPRSRAIARA